ncbi:hypothetical protein POF45_17030 [Pseudomonas sp. 681]|uniref:Uncharacterized protein n=1 Tax=Pseudomonas fungipugnans TaxID=3024217 RepID=A0ABT6QQM3_9PSED|nr:hypothetical protein [Pseudomonas sp. 681]MDI2593119.1 hypothetical protein [Pseudomonas sp. 681]
MPQKHRARDDSERICTEIVRVTVIPIQESYERPKPSAGLIEFLATQPLYALCREQVMDVCHLIDQCCLRIQTDDINSDLNTLCIQTTRHEEAIFQYASTDTSARLADWVRQYGACPSATVDQAHAAYIMACAVKALEVLSDWMRVAEQDAWSHTTEIPDWPWDLYCEFVEMQVKSDERIEALEQYVMYLEPIASLPSLQDDELLPFAVKTIKNAVRRKGGVLSGKDRNEEISDRDAAIVNHARSLLRKGMSHRNVTTATHRWLEREIAKPIKQRPEWIPLEAEKALTRKQVSSILKRYWVV